MKIYQLPVNLSNFSLRTDEEEKPNTSHPIPGSIPNNKRRKKKDKDLRKNIRKIKEDLELEKETQVSANIIKKGKA